MQKTNVRGLGEPSAERRLIAGACPASTKTPGPVLGAPSIRLPSQPALFLVHRSVAPVALADTTRDVRFSRALLINHEPIGPCSAHIGGWPPHAVSPKYVPSTTASEFERAMIRDRAMAGPDATGAARSSILFLICS